ncbi:MAG: hypothetical protein CML84_03555 [Rhodobiaceae bacterium]|nr:hypothetical protein [Rhodobiaceae bacterium]
MHDSKTGRNQKMKNTNIIRDIVQCGYNSGLGYDLSNFTNYFITQNEQVNKRAIDRIKNSLMDTKIERTLYQPISRYTNIICY